MFIEEDVLEPGQEMIIGGFSNSTLSVRVNINSHAVIDHFKSN